MASAPSSSNDSPASLVETLSPRRREILQLLSRGLTNEEIAGAIHITTGTVRTHVAALLAHLDVSNRTEAAVAYVAWEARPAQVAAVLQRPAIAVLPVLWPETDPRAGTVAAGFTEDLASLLARWCWFPVIASASTVDARTLGATSPEIARKLGARFLVDGSLGRRGERWRLSVRVDDGQDGHCLWSEQYQFTDRDLFDVQDATCQTVVASAYPVMVARAQAGLARGSRPGDLAAWELAHTGMALQATRDAPSNAAARDHFRRAVEREPDLVLAHFGQGLAAYDALLNQWDERERALDALAAAAEHCLTLAPHAGEGYYLLARHAQARSDPAAAVGPLESAVGRNPSFALAHALLAQVLALSGRTEEALPRMSHAVRLSPRAFVAGLAALLFIRGEFVAALDAAERTVAGNPRYTFARVLAAACAHWAGQPQRARAHLRLLHEQHPHFRPQAFLATFGGHVGAVARIVRALEECERQS